MRTFFIALSFYLAALALVDSISFEGHYRRAVWREASNQAYRVNAELRHMLDRIGI